MNERLVYLGLSRVGVGVALAVGAAHAVPRGATAQSFTIQSRVDVVYADIPPVVDSCSTHSGTFCTAEARTGPAQDGEAYGFGAYQDIVFGGEIRGISYAWGAGPPFGPPSEVRSQVQVFTEVVFDSRSTTLPPATPIRVRSFIPVHGLVAVQAAPGAELLVIETLFVSDHMGIRQILYQGSLQLRGGAIEFGGQWTGDEVPATVQIPGQMIFLPGFELDTLDIVSYDTVLGEKFEIMFQLDITSAVPGPFEHFAIADFGNTTSFTLEAVDPVTGDPLDVTFEPIRCYADCDQSTGLVVLDVFDFLCFQDRFVSADSYACDCDTSTGAAVCDIFDFLCFQDAFTLGCQ